jgi:hypothetical protein
MTSLTPWGVADNHDPALQKTKTKDAGFTIVHSEIFDLHGDSFEDDLCVCEV